MILFVPVLSGFRVSPRSQRRPRAPGGHTGGRTHRFALRMGYGFTTPGRSRSSRSIGGVFAVPGLLGLMWLTKERSPRLRVPASLRDDFFSSPSSRVFASPHGRSANLALWADTQGADTQGETHRGRHTGGDTQGETHTGADTQVRPYGWGAASLRQVVRVFAVRRGCFYRANREIGGPGTFS